MAKGNGWTDSLLLKQNATPRDTGRRGQPRPGCDCVQCFGFCDVSKDAEMRVRLDAAMFAHEDKAAD